MNEVMIERKELSIKAGCGFMGITEHFALLLLIKLGQ